MFITRLLLLLFISSGLVHAHTPRVFEFNYEITATDLPSDRVVDIYVPLPVEDESQVLLKQRLESSIPGQVRIEQRYGNRVYHVSRAAGDDSPVHLNLSWTVRREVQRAGTVTGTDAQTLEFFLQPNNRVPVGHEILNPILAEVHALRADDSAAATARAIYDWVVDNVEYKKIGVGWGNGDTFWACNERYGNCTDFHALFVSLARTEGIPARFEIGFPVPEDREAGTVNGYHCWVEFYLPDLGWVPIDASEAAKHPENRELYYGSHPADRIHFSTGRDLVLSEGSRKKPLNYLVYPYVEVDGAPFAAELRKQFSYRSPATQEAY